MKCFFIMFHIFYVEFIGKLMYSTFHNKYCFTAAQNETSAQKAKTFLESFIDEDIDIYEHLEINYIFNN